MSANEKPPIRRAGRSNAADILQHHTKALNLNPIQVDERIVLASDHVETVFTEGKLTEATMNVGGLSGEECWRSLEQYGYTVTKNLTDYFLLKTFERNRRKTRETDTFVFITAKELFPALPFARQAAGWTLMDINIAAKERGLSPVFIDDGAHLAMSLKDELRNYPVYFSSHTFVSLSYGAILRHNGRDLYRVKQNRFFQAGSETDVMVFIKNRL